MSVSILVKHFFKSHPLTPDFYSQWEKLGPWGPRLLPIYHWDDVLYVAGSEMPDNFRDLPGHKIVFVFCEELVLKEAWDQLHSQPITLELQDEVVSDTPVPDDENEPQDHEMPGGLDLNLSISPPKISLTDLTQSEPLPKPLNENIIDLQFPPDPVIEKPAKDNHVQLDFHIELNDLEKHFSKWVLLTKEDGFFRPLAASHNLAAEFQKLKEFRLNTNQPSSWRIVERSKKSFHGKPAHSEALEFFRQNWISPISNTNEIAHLTISPIIIAAEVIGFLTCFEPKTDISVDVTASPSLKSAEEAAEKVYQQLNSLNQSAA